MALGTAWYVAAGLVMFAVGTYCLLMKRNIIRIVIGLEIVTTAVHLNFIALSYSSPIAVNPLAQVVVVISMVLGACVATVALMYAINIYRHYGSLDIRRLKRLRW